MSLRKMLKVSLLMLLAMALAATTVHARLDLFGQLHTSKNQPKPNSEEVQVLVKGSGAIPYTECINTCDICFCTLKWPPESNMCICGDNSKSKKPTSAVQEVESSSSKVKSKIMPYSECTEKCKYVCACTPIWPPELSTCICSDEVEELHKELDLLPKPLEKSGGGFMPYPECIKKCDECTTCTKIYPIEKAWCYCGKNTISNSNKPAIQNSEGVLQMLAKGKGKSNVDNEPSGAIPYTECMNTCDLCFCTRKWPPESNMCICGDNSKSKKLTAAVQKLESSSSIVKSEVLPYTECIKSCKHVCACTLIYPPELSTCVCSDLIESTAPKAVGS
ncbi:hypothetical protein M0R45_028667 [Rubus argutus]|uniref:Uncharacterized protein n=1 Tax=Rubus argutus TaxID=59490 RepID=A0AAW1W823_RUBAR